MKPTDRLGVVRSALRSGAVPIAATGRATRGAVPVVTISRQAGIDAEAIARRVAEILGGPEAGEDQHWTSYDRALVERVAGEHEVPASAVRSHDERDEGLVESMIHGLAGSRTEIAPLIAKTIRGIAEQGRAVIVGRGGQAILAHVPGAVHVRLVAPEDWRVKEAARTDGIGLEEAQQTVRRVDAEREHFVKAHFHCDLADPANYDLVINVARIGPDEAARLITMLVRR